MLLTSSYLCQECHSFPLSPQSPADKIILTEKNWSKLSAKHYYQS